MSLTEIIIRGAREHNLKNIDLKIPRNKLVVITGLSGSGKSTLAFDTIYAEGQRRYVESLSTYARQFLEQMDKPDVDSIEGLSPAISIQARSTSKNPRSTVGTVTEIYDYLRLLFSRIGHPFCPNCNIPIAAQSVQQVVDQVMAFEEGSRIMVLSPVVNNRKGEHAALFERLRKEGFVRVQVDGDIASLDSDIRLDKNKKHSIRVVVDRLVVGSTIKRRLTDSLELAFSLSEGSALVDVVDDGEYFFSQRASCPKCGFSFPPLTPQMFSFNSPLGACQECGGLGTKMYFDPDLIVPNPYLSLREGAIAPWAERNTVYFHQMLDSLAQHYGIDIYTPFRELPEQVQHVFLYGSGDEEIQFYFDRDDRRHFYKRPFEGVIPNLNRRYHETDSSYIRDTIERFMNIRPCPQCEGARLRPESLAVKINGKSIAEVTSFSIETALEFFEGLALADQEKLIGHRILKEITERLGFLMSVGLHYISLERATSTLSGGEEMRIRLATQIGSGLSGVLYVLDEPSIGLHHRDNDKLLATLKRLRELGNTVLVVEHDPETILSGDYVVDMGPGAGQMGGEVVFTGNPDELMADEQSLTGLYLSGRRSIPVPKKRREGNRKEVIIEGAAENNLKDIDVAIPLGTFICITGVSGSGKSSLINQILYPALAQRLYGSRERVGKVREIRGIEYLDKVINIDQSPIGRTPRSNPATYTGIFTHIRALFSKLPEARVRGYSAGRFSFNVEGGRCEACRGDGIIKIEMHFLPDVYVTCDVCKGLRYNRDTLEIRYRGRNIADVLDMTVEEAMAFFSSIPQIRERLETLFHVGLGYIKLGQSATTLSGGEAQRVKLAKELGKRSTGRTLYLLDEPTTGLHFADIQKLLEVLNHLVEAKNTVVVIEHNMDVIKSADYIVDLGPEGGDRGGSIVATGTPEEIVDAEGSYTGQYLKDNLRARSGPVREHA
ncbi:MAG: excinuclease ABC subunit UvrA [Deltaproteobacteria bacterium]|nr:excinuclease ABC subunit UvrA [Deltaproteobacteria bacterium]MBW2075983.1 excinuclease ABC subunit UvrA [Deltaproteobacteria bacterium]MBW2310864.1 excinuclease ABC subunit UvrA [Deltaproteobacteria bacterium]